MAKRLYIEFTNDGGDVMRLGLDDPKEDLNEGLVREKADLIVGAGVFSIKGDKATQVKKAYTREVISTEIF